VSIWSGATGAIILARVRAALRLAVSVCLYTAGLAFRFLSLLSFSEAALNCLRRLVALIGSTIGSSTWFFCSSSFILLSVVYIILYALSLDENTNKYESNIEGF
jgi:hypothetical protein